MRALRRYIDKRMVVGGFLEAVLSNNLTAAVAHADARNARALPNIACYLHNEAPIECWGSSEKYKEWRKGK